MKLAYLTFRTFVFSFFFFTSLTFKHLSSSLAGLGRVWRDDPSLHWHPSAPLVLQQEEVRLTKGQEELKRVCWGGVDWGSKSKILVGTGSPSNLITHIGGEGLKASTVTKK